MWGKRAETRFEGTHPGGLSWFKWSIITLWFRAKLDLACLRAAASRSALSLPHHLQIRIPSSSCALPQIYTATWWVQPALLPSRRLSSCLASDCCPERGKGSRVSLQCLPRSGRGGGGWFGCPTKPRANSMYTRGPWAWENSRLGWCGSHYVGVWLFSVWASHGGVVCWGDAVCGWWAEGLSELESHAISSWAAHNKCIQWNRAIQLAQRHHLF